MLAVIFVGRQPLTVFNDGTTNWLADGFHRYYGAEAADVAEVPVEIQQGTLRDAILHSVSANATHGLRRSNEDKRRAVMRLLEDPEWSAWSDREIARRCAVTHPFVGSLRPASNASSGNGYQMGRPRIVDRGGKVFEQNTARIGRRPDPPPSPEPAREAAPGNIVHLGARLRPILSERSAELIA